MLNAQQLVKTGLDYATQNAPGILTIFGAAGVVTTAVLTGKASFQAADRIREAKLEKADVLTAQDGAILGPIELTKTEMVKEVWPLYIPAVITGTSSIAAIVMSHRISSRRAAVLAAAYALNQDKLEEYQDKIKEKLGLKKEEAVRAEIHQDRVIRAYESNEAIFSPVDGKVCIMEEYTGRYFWYTREGVENAVNQINALVNKEGSARLSDFYDLIGLSHVSTSDYYGFTTNDYLELHWDTSTTPDGATAVHTFEYVNHPVMNPEREAGFR